MKPTCEHCGTEVREQYYNDVAKPFEVKAGVYHSAARCRDVLLSAIRARDMSLRGFRAALQNARSALVAARGALRLAGGWEETRSDVTTVIAECDALLPENHPDHFPYEDPA
jgi:hypothetical protein